MKRVFFSFDYDDVFRVNQIRNSWVTQGNEAAGFVDKADFEKVQRQGKQAIKNWIDKQLKGTSVTCVLIGEYTYLSEWVKYEIVQSIEKRNGLIGIYMHNQKDQNGKTGVQGENPFTKPPINFRTGGEVYPCCSVYDWVNNNGYDNFGAWVEHAIRQASG